MRRLPTFLAIIAVEVLVTSAFGGCGARTGLPIPESLSFALTSETGGDVRDVAKKDTSIGPRCATAIPVGDPDNSAYLEIVLDGSGSMDADNKWLAASSALESIFSDLSERADRSLAVGLIIFEDEKDISHGVGPYPTKLDVPPRMLDATQLAALRLRLLTSPRGGTPSATALRGAYEFLRDYSAPPPLPPNARKVVVFMSDGVPNGGADEQYECIRLATGALQDAVDPIRTFSVGIGPFENDELSYDPPFMGRLAIAGGTRASETCDPNSTDVAKACHFQITPNGRPLDEITQDFIDAMIAIRGRLRSSCDMDIVGNVSAVDFSKTTARWVDRLGASHPIPKSATNGWSYDSATAPRKVLIHGPTCTTILADPLSEIDVSLVCP